jgi:transposase-like protein
VGTLHTWIKQLKSKSIEAEALDAGPNIAVLLEENRRLHRELAHAWEEKDILKKAAAYFAVNQK